MSGFYPMQLIVEAGFQTVIHPRADIFQHLDVTEPSAFLEAGGNSEAMGAMNGEKFPKKKLPSNLLINTQD